MDTSRTQANLGDVGTAKLPRAAVIVCSDRATSGEYKDESGPAAARWLSSHGFDVVAQAVVADESALLIGQIIDCLETSDVVVVSGGTGLGSRDITPQTLNKLCDYEIPGIGELLRTESLKYTPNAYLSRCGGWMKDRKLVLGLPGNPAAVVEQLDILKNLLPKALQSINGTCKHRHKTAAAVPGSSDRRADAEPQ